MAPEVKKELLEVYTWGFNDEIQGNVKMWNANPLLLRAYNLGREDASVSNIRYADDDILTRIRGDFNQTFKKE